MNKVAIFRTLDANLNRLREALRVCEDITRFVLDDGPSTAKLKQIRHEAFLVITDSVKIKYPSLVLSRDTGSDVGKKSLEKELKRADTLDILSANMQRAKESVRVLEEFSKLEDPGTAERFKNIRFKIYDVEKTLVERI